MASWRIPPKPAVRATFFVVVFDACAHAIARVGITSSPRTTRSP
jgi:hypothetical protein